MDIKELSEKLISALTKYKSILIYIKGSPDPDVIASSYALMQICHSMDIKSAITGSTKPSLPQNNAIINELDIPIIFKESFDDLSEYDSYAVLDFQSANINGITGKIPCAIHIDHHEPVEEDIEIDFKLIIDEAGSTSSFFALVIKELETSLYPVIELRKTATALQLGIYTDTDAYRHANNIDFDALNYVSNISDRKILNHVVEIPLPDHVIKLISKAVADKEEYKNWIFTGIGFIEESIRDSIPIIADFMIRRFKCSVVIVFAAVIRKKPQGLRLDASFRTDDENLDLDLLIKEITQTGGGRKYKGAYQVDLNYFADSPDRDLLWNVIKSTTISHIKHLRDKSQLVEIKGFYKRMKRQAEKIFKL
jgi:nanoRNase/pAp phosphatase (c-di-AMP/oligoRNAs hydrolase)